MSAFFLSCQKSLYQFGFPSWVALPWPREQDRINDLHSNHCTHIIPTIAMNIHIFIKERYFYNYYSFDIEKMLNIRKANGRRRLSHLSDDTTYRLFLIFNATGGLITRIGLHSGKKNILLSQIFQIF
ncbi:unnamed protein product [Angiostrongylus costaricensis]|uniref:Uncharacterized protein n=1 Tax=Angiostrongylus costaricensis TaxID=334426 RepID=A0A0R3PUG3_ANGCS|nr:unnamed protein product [Angiostrongylus costaricensis]